MLITGVVLKSFGVGPTFFQKFDKVKLYQLYFSPIKIK
jgi:hypothetical protein